MIDNDEPPRSFNEQEFLEEIQSAQESGDLKKRIPRKVIAEMIAIASKDEYYDLIDLVTEVFPQYLAGEARRDLRELERDNREYKRTGEYAPTVTINSNFPNRSADDPSATDKQLNYLRDLGVRDEKFLRSLGKSQAGKAIEQLIAARQAHFNKVDAPPKSKGGSCFLIVAAIVIWLIYKLLS